MGHSDIHATMNVYAQAPDEMEEETARLVGEMLFGLNPVVPRGD